LLYSKRVAVFFELLLQFESPSDFAASPLIDLWLHFPPLKCVPLAIDRLARVQPSDLLPSPHLVLNFWPQFRALLYEGAPANRHAARCRITCPPLRFLASNASFLKSLSELRIHSCFHVLSGPVGSSLFSWGDFLPSEVSRLCLIAFFLGPSASLVLSCRGLT